MNQLFSLTLLFIIALTSCDSANKATVSKEIVNTKPLDSLFNFAISNHEIPAAALMIIHKGETVYDKAFGWKNLEEEQVLKKTDLFRIASMTKAITAVGVMQLVENGQISVDDEISKFIPEFQNPTILVEVLEDSSFTSKPAENEITIRHLLTHTSGLGYGFQSETYNALLIKNGLSEGFEERPITNIENARNVAAIPLLHEPGAQWTYSLSFDILGAIIEIVTGQSLDVYFSQNIFKPLGMTDTYFFLPDNKVDRLVKVYEYNADKTGFIRATYEFTEYPVRGAKMYMSGGGDLSSTTKDIGVFAQMLLNKGIYNDKRILQEKTVEMMSSKQSEHGWWNSEVGFGLYTLTEAGAAENSRAEGSYDFGGFFDTWCWVDPEHELIGIIFLQMYPNNDYRMGSRFQDLTYQVIQNN